MLSEAVSDGEVDDLQTALPDEYDRLFELAAADEHPDSEYSRAHHD